MTDDGSNGKTMFSAYESISHEIDLTIHKAIQLGFEDESGSNTETSPTTVESEQDLSRVQPTRWVVLEKVDGANFSCTYDTSTSQWKCGRRTAFLQPEESFFQYQNVWQDLEPRLCQLVQNGLQPQSIDTLIPGIRERYPNVDTSMILAFIVYGELFGGYYPHELEEQQQVEGAPTTKNGEETLPNTSTSAGAKQTRKKIKGGIQKRVQYSPNIHFLAFDIAVQVVVPTGGEEDGASSAVTPEKFYLDYELAMEYFQKYSIPYSRPLTTTNSIREAVQYPLEFDSTLPQLLELPQPGPHPNQAEGIIVKPLRHNRVLFAYHRYIETLKPQDQSTDLPIQEQQQDEDKEASLEPGGEHESKPPSRYRLPPQAIYRPLLKIKHEKFDESKKATAALNNGNNWVNKKKKKKGKNKNKKNDEDDTKDQHQHQEEEEERDGNGDEAGSLDPRVVELVSKLGNRVTLNRLWTAVSKVGPLNVAEEEAPPQSTNEKCTETEALTQQQQQQQKRDNELAEEIWRDILHEDEGQQQNFMDSNNGQASSSTTTTTTTRTTVADKFQELSTNQQDWVRKRIQSRIRKIIDSARR